MDSLSIQKALPIMWQNRISYWLLLLIALIVPTTTAHADDGVETRSTNIYSEGARLHADVYHLKSLVGKALPTIIMAHGWGGTAASLRTQATDFASAGYFVIAFDYRGWGNSDSRLILTEPAAENHGHIFVAEVKEIREVVDPVDQLQDYLNAIHWAIGEAMADRNRIGLWGTSFSGGLVVAAAARDSRVKALVSQVGYFGSAVNKLSPQQLVRARDEGSKRARGELAYPLPRAREVGGLSGGPIREKFLLYDAVEDAANVKNCAMLFIAAEKEELFDNKDHPGAAFGLASEPKKYVVIANIAHYGIYSEARQEASDLAVRWFNQHLK